MSDQFTNTKLLIRQLEERAHFLETHDNRRELRLLRTSLKKLQRQIGPGNNDQIESLMKEISIKQDEYNKLRIDTYPSKELVELSQLELNTYEEQREFFYSNLSIDDLTRCSSKVVDQIRKNLARLPKISMFCNPKLGFEIQQQIEWSERYIDIIEHLRLEPTEAIPSAEADTSVSLQSCKCYTGMTHHRYYFFAHDSKCRQYLMDQFNKYRRFPDELEYLQLKSQVYKLKN